MWNKFFQKLSYHRWPFVVGHGDESKMQADNRQSDSSHSGHVFSVTNIHAFERKFVIPVMIWIPMSLSLRKLRSYVKAKKVY